jgi:hypothetical protein
VDHRGLFRALFNKHSVFDLLTLTMEGPRLCTYS